MKKVILLAVPSLFMIGCTSTRIDDHSYRLNSSPPNVVTTYNRNTTNNTTHNYAQQTERCFKEHPNKQTVLREDREYLQFLQEDPIKDSGDLHSRRENGMYIEYDEHNTPTVVPKNWKSPITSRNYIPPGNAGIPVYYIR